MPTRYFFLSGLLIILTSCRSASPGTEPEPVTPENPSPLPPLPELTPRNSWSLQPTNHQYKYRSSTVSSVVMDQAPISARDSTTLTTDFTLSLSRGAQGDSYAITIDGISSTPASRTSPSAVPGLSSPISFTAHIETGRVTLSTTTDCNNQASSALSVIQRALILLPLQLQRGQTWTDSTSGSACSGSIPVMLTALRQYRVVGETSDRAYRGLLLERLDKTTSAGEGAEGQHRIQLRSEGTGQTQLLIDPLTGVLLEATTTNTTVATVTASGRSRRFTQTSREHVEQR